MIIVKKTILLFLCIIYISSTCFSSLQPRLMSSSEIQLALKKMLVVGGALYIAAHPDDENTSILSWLNNEKKVRTGYLSITRGGGGQNLIGAEKGPLMSVLRTHELLAAREIDGAEQFFTCGVDFGYSKTAEESIKIWGREHILEDIVFIIRKFKPDILLSRFPPEGRGHGHHVASAVLAIEAFKASGDPSRFPEQLKYVSVWQPRRIFWNTWRPWMKDVKPEELKNLIKVDVGVFNRFLGKSYTEIAAKSRSMHKSQGFGVVARRGKRTDYFSLLAGAPAKEGLFDGIDISWNRIPGSEKIKKIFQKANKSFDPEQPHKTLPLLIDALVYLNKLPESCWTRQKGKELHHILRSCAGLWLEAISGVSEVTMNQEIKVKTTAINRSDFPLRLKELIIPGNAAPVKINREMKNNIPVSQDVMIRIHEKESTHPYWLKEEIQKGFYSYKNNRFKGLPKAPYNFIIKAVLEARGQEIFFEIPVLYRWRDPVEGEQYQALVVTPPVTLNFFEKVLYFPDQNPKRVKMILRSGPSPVSGKLEFDIPGSWNIEPEYINFRIDEPFTRERISVLVRPPSREGSCKLGVNISTRGQNYNQSQVSIRYPHIPVITLHPAAELRLVKVQLKRFGKNIGYIMGSGDGIPVFLTQVGYNVELLSDEDLYNHNLDKYDSIITGIRAYNTRDILKHIHKRLLDYVKRGGRLIVQYNVSRRLYIQSIGPYPFKISRKRVSEETAPVSLLEPAHPLLNFPNKIQKMDFSDWIQERGLYFAESWDHNYSSPLSCSDSGEEAQKGGLLFCRYGKGIFIYTGYSFFRQLPAGNKGALKLFINIIDLDRKQD